MYIRSYRPEDCSAILQLFFQTVHTVNAKDYTPQQLDAWADGKEDPVLWNLSLSQHNCLVAISDGILVGFADMDATGYLDRLYVHKDYQRQGIGKALCDHLEAHAPSDCVTVAASITAKPFFEARGYRVVREQQVERKGCLLTNFLMAKILVPSPHLSPVKKILK